MKIEDVDMGKYVEFHMHGMQSLAVKCNYEELRDDMEKSPDTLVVEDDDGNIRVFRNRSALCPPPPKGFRIAF